MSAIEDRRAHNDTSADALRQAEIDAATVTTCAGMNHEHSTTATFGSQFEWISADAHRNGNFDLSIHEYDELNITASLTREEALALRDFITATYES